MNPWMKLFSRYLSQQYSTCEKPMQTTLVTVQSLRELLNESVFENVINLLEKCKFVTVIDVIGKNSLISTDLFKLHQESVTSKYHEEESNNAKRDNNGDDGDDTGNDRDSNGVKDINDLEQRNNSYINEGDKEDSNCKDAGDNNITVPKQHRAQHLLICTIEPFTELQNGSLCIKDQTGFCILCGRIDRKDVYKTVFFLKWKYILPDQWSSGQRVNVRREHIQYIEVDRYIVISTTPTTINNTFPTCYSVSHYKLYSKTTKHLHLKSIVLAKSPVHKMHKYSPFYFVMLRCNENPNQSIAVVLQGRDKIHWYNNITLFDSIKLTHLSLSLLNKGTSNERRVLCTTKETQFVQSSIQYNDDTKTDLINYIGYITSTNQSQYGIYTLDEKIKLLISHQPNLTFCQGFRCGAQIHVANVHKLELKGNIYLCCCTLSTVEILKMSPELSFFRPFISLRHDIAGEWQKIYLYYYVWLVDCIESTRCLDLKDSSKLTSILLSYIKETHEERSIFSEFLDLPHSCIFTKSYNVKPSDLLPKCLSVVDFRMSVFKIVENKEVIWLNGRECDSYPHHDTQTWYFTSVDHEELSLILGGKLTKSGTYVKLVDKTGYIYVLSDSELPIGASILIVKYRILIEKFNCKKYNRCNGNISESTIYKQCVIVSKNGYHIIETSVESNVENDEKRCRKERLETRSSMSNNEAVTLDGVIVSREFKRTSSRDHDMECLADSRQIYVPGLGIQKCEKLESSNSSLYPFTTSMCIFRLLTMESGRNVSIYFDSNKNQYPLALLPGVHGKFTTVKHVTKNGRICYKMQANKQIEILQFPTSFELGKLTTFLEELRSSSELYLEKTLIMTLYDGNKINASNGDKMRFDSTRRLFIGRISLVQSVFVYWKCLRCYKRMSNGKCLGKCGDRKIFQTEMRCVVEDGTGEIFLHFEDKNVVKMLQFSNADYELLKQTSLQYGVLSYQRNALFGQGSESTNDVSKSRQCEILLLKSVSQMVIFRCRRFYCKPFKTKKVQEMFQNCAFNCGQTEYHTFQQRKKLFQCLSFRNLDYSSDVRNYYKTSPQQRNDEVVV